MLYHITGAVFKVLLVLLPLVFAATIVFGSSASLEHAARESRVYEQFVSVVLDNSKDQAKDPQAQQLLSDPEIRSAIEESFPPQLLETSGSSVIQGVFAWLQGKTAEPEFTIDLSSAKSALMANVTEVAKKRADGLPVCTIAQLRTFDPNTDLLSLPCIPPGTDITAASQQFSSQLIDDAEFLNNPVITNQTLAADGQPLVNEKAQKLPKLYQAAQTARWILLGVVLALGLLLVFARRNRRAGVRHVAWSLLGAATFWIIAMAAYWFMFDKANTAGAEQQDVQAMLLDGGKVLLTDLNRVIGICAGVYVALGGGLLVLLRFTKPHTTEAVAPGNEPDTPKEASSDKIV